MVPNACADDSGGVTGSEEVFNGSRFFGCFARGETCDVIGLETTDCEALCMSNLLTTDCERICVSDLTMGVLGRNSVGGFFGDGESLK